MRLMPLEQLRMGIYLKIMPCSAIASFFTNLIFHLCNISFSFTAAWPEGRGCVKASEPVRLLSALHFGCHGSNVLCVGSHTYVAQRSDSTQRETNLRERLELLVVLEFTCIPQFCFSNHNA
jgi:hypothetical protein